MDIEDIQFLVWLAVAVGCGITFAMIPGKNVVKRILTLIILAGSTALVVALSTEGRAIDFLVILLAALIIFGFAALCTWVCREIPQAWRTAKQMNKDDWKKWINDSVKEIGSLGLVLVKLIGNLTLLYLLIIFLIGALIVALIVHAPLLFLVWLLHAIADAFGGG